MLVSSEKNVIASLNTANGKIGKSLINFNEIIVQNEKNGKPFIRLKGETKKKIDKKLKKKAKFFLSLSDEQKYAVAFVTIFV